MNISAWGRLAVKESDSVLEVGREKTNMIRCAVIGLSVNTFFSTSVLVDCRDVHMTLASFILSLGLLPFTWVYTFLLLMSLYPLSDFIWVIQWKHPLIEFWWSKWLKTNCFKLIITNSSDFKPSKRSLLSSYQLKSWNATYLQNYLFFSLSINLSVQMYYFLYTQLYIHILIYKCTYRCIHNTYKYII